MGRQFVAPGPRRACFLRWNLLPKPRQLTNQQVDLPLLADNDLVELIHHVFGETDLDLQVSQALFGVVRVFHHAIGPELRMPHRLRAIVE